MSKTGNEIERKWRLRKIPQWVLEKCYRTSIIQGYLVISEKGEVRLRNEDGNMSLTVKGAGALKRLEEDYPFKSQLGYELLWPNIIGAAIEKARYKVQDGDVVLEFDFHFGFLEGYFCVEVEFDDVESAEAFILPDWVENALEVTNDKRYKAKNLALNHKTVRQDLGLAD